MFGWKFMRSRSNSFIVSFSQANTNSGPAPHTSLAL
jgi:hypothetical protein